MTSWIIYPRYVSLYPDNAFEWMREEARRHGIRLEIIFFEDLIPISSAGGEYLLLNGEKVEDYPDLVITRGYDRVVSRHFELRGIPVVNSTESMFLSKDKLLSGQLFAREGLPVPVTAGGTAEEWDYATLCEMFGSGTFIVKRRDGAKGEDVYLIDDEELMREAVKKCGGNCIAQQFISESCGRDLRVWVIGGRAVACVMRYSEKSFKANFSQGGKAMAYEMTGEISSLAERSAAVTGLEFAGVDLLFGDQGPVLCEVNGNAGFRTLSDAGKNDIPRHLFAYVAATYGKKSQ